MTTHTTSEMDSNNTSDENTKRANIVSYRRWFVLTSGYFVMFLTCGFAFNFSILVPELLLTFGRSKAETASVPSITAGMLGVAGIICGKFVSRYGARITGIIESLLSALGVVFSFFATGIPDLIVTLGLVSGLGFSASSISAYTSVGEYFEGKSKLLALAFLTFGSGCGGIIIPFVLNALIDEFGWRGSLLIMGGIMANMMSLFAICQPVHVGIAEKPTNNSKHLESERKFQKQDVFINSIRSLLGNKVYIIHVVATCLTISVINSVMIFMIDFLTTKDVDTETSMVLYLYTQIGSTLFGVVPGLFKMYIPHINEMIISALFTAVGATGIAFLPTTDAYVQNAVLLVCFGIAVGVSFTTVTMTTMEIVGLHNYTAGLGTLMTLIGICSSIAGPLTGWFIDLTGSFSKPFYGISACLGLASCLYVFAGILNQRRVNKNMAIKTTAAKVDISVIPS